MQRSLLSATVLTMFIAGSAAAHPAVSNATAAVTNVLKEYQQAVERLDARGTERLFAPESEIIESGSLEGNYAKYLAHHLTPELGEFKSFKFSEYNVRVRFEGPLALTTESYRYRIEPKEGTVAEGRGIVTSVLKKVDGLWKIISSHTSARRSKTP